MAKAPKAEPTWNVKVMVRGPDGKNVRESYAAATEAEAWAWTEGKQLIDVDIRSSNDPSYIEKYHSDKTWAAAAGAW